jgi:hypothetical protein
LKPPAGGRWRSGPGAAERGLLAGLRLLLQGAAAGGETLALDIGACWLAGVRGGGGGCGRGGGGGGGAYAAGPRG